MKMNIFTFQSRGLVRSIVEYKYKQLKTFLFLDGMRREVWFGLSYVPPCCENSPVNLVIGNIISAAVAFIQDTINNLWQYLFQRYNKAIEFLCQLVKCTRNNVVN